MLPLIATQAIILQLADVRVCLINNIFHIPCPGCGVTRAVILILHGKIMTSMQYSLLPLPMLVALALFGTVVLSGKYNAFAEFLRHYRWQIFICLFCIMLMIWCVNLHNELLY